MRKNKLFKAISILLAALTILSAGTSAFAATGGELPTSISEGEAQSALTPQEGEPSTGAAGPAIQPDTQPSAEPLPAQTAQAEATAAPVQTPQAEETPVRPESTDITITTLADLQKIGIDPAYPLDGTYVLTNDIDGKQPDGTSATLAPIGSIDAPFTGTIDGGNHKISNIEIKNEDVFAPHSGLFASFDGTVKNLALIDVTVTGNTAGIFAGTIGGNAQVSGLFITGSVAQPVFPEDTEKEKIPAFIAGGLAGHGEAGEQEQSPQKIENTAVFATLAEQQPDIDAQTEEELAKEAPVTEPNKQLGAFIGDNSIPTDKFTGNLWSSAYGQDNAFGMDSIVNASDGVSKIETSPTYLALMTGQSGVLSANEQAGEAFGLTFNGWETDDMMVSLSSDSETDVTIKAGEIIGVVNAAAVYRRTWTDGTKTEVRFITPVIISQMIDEEKELEPVDPVFPTQIEEVKPLEPVDDIFPTILSETVPLTETGAVVEISTWEQLQNIGNTDYNAAYTMDADYVLSADIVAEEGAFTPIGTEENPFAGTFDGKGFTIDVANNTDIDRNQVYYGLFGTVKPWADGEAHSNFVAENPKNPMVPEKRIKNLYLKADLEVLVQPCDQEVVPGQDVELNAVANDQPNLSYQWQVSADGGVSWTDILGATDSQYTFTTQNDESQNGYQYRCRMTAEQQAEPSLLDIFAPAKALAADGDRVVYSQPATLTVNAKLYSARAATGNPNSYMDGWMGWSTNESNRAMVWFGNYDQWGDANGEPVLNRVLYSDDSRIMLLTEYMMKGVGYDNASGGRTPHYYSSTWNRSSNMRAFLTNGSADWAGKGRLDYSSSGYLNSFNGTERSWIRDTYLSAERGNESFNGSNGGNVTDKLFLLTLGEIQNTRYFPNGGSSRTAKATPKAGGAGSMMYTGVHDMWSVRTPAGNDYINLSSFNGAVGAPVAIFDNANVGSRPAMNLDANKVTLVAAGNTGGEPNVNNTLTKLKGDAVSKNSQWQLAYGGDSQTLRVFARGGETLNVSNITKKGNQLIIDWNNATYYNGNYLGVMLVNTDTHEKWVARASVIATPSWTDVINIPAGSMVGSNWKLYLWNESQYLRRTSIPIVYTPDMITGLKPSIADISVSPNGWATNKSVSFRVWDNGDAGINRVFWSDRSGQATGNKLENQGNHTYRIPQLYPSGGNATRTIYLVAYENDGGRTETRVDITQLDNAAPSVSNVAATVGADGDSFVISATLSDAQSGIERAFASKNSGATNGIAMKQKSGNTWATESFTGEGNYYVIAYDKVGNRSVSSSPVKLEQQSPLIENVQVLPGDWAREKSISAQVTDRSSTGISRVFFSNTSDTASGTQMVSAGGGKYVSTGGVTAEGTYYVTALSISGARKQVAVSAQKIDRTGPTVTGGVCEVQDGGYTEYIISATVTDGQSGVGRAFLSTDKDAVDGIPMMVRSGNIWASGVFTGTGDYYIIAYDKAGNRNVSAAPVRTLLTPPEISNVKQEPDGWATSKTISASIIDKSGSGLEPTKIFYTSTSGATEPGSSAYLLTSTGDNSYRSGAIASPGVYYIVAYDKYGGRSEVMIQITQIDRVGPEIRDAKQNPSGWAQKKTISATVVDLGVGVDRVFYSTNQNATSGTAMTGSGSLYTSGQLPAGTYYIIAYDQLNNRSTTKVVVDKIDTTPPVISDAKQDQEEVATAKTISAVVTDNGAVARVYYSATAFGATNGNDMTLQNGRYTSSPVSREGVYYIYAIDEAGNRTQNGVPVTVEGMPEAVGKDDPMYWLDSEEAAQGVFVYFGGYAIHYNSTTLPLLWFSGDTVGNGDGGSTPSLFGPGVATLYCDNLIEVGNYGADNWAGSNVRAWLNGQSGMMNNKQWGTIVKDEDTYRNFYPNAFNTTEKSYIASTGLEDSGTVDKVFIPNKAETKQYGWGNRSEVIVPKAAVPLILKEDGSSTYTGQALAVDTIRDGGSFGLMFLREPGLIVDGTTNRLLDKTITDIERGDVGISPAINMLTSSVMYVPASSSGNQPLLTTAINKNNYTSFDWGANFQQIYSRPYISTKFRVFGRGGTSAPSADLSLKVLDDTTFQVSYSNMKGGGDNYISVFILERQFDRLWTARVLKATNPSGSTEVSYDATLNGSSETTKKSLKDCIIFAWIESEQNKKTSETFVSTLSAEKPGEDTSAPLISNAQQVPNEWTASSKTISAVITDESSVAQAYISTQASGATSGTALALSSGDMYVSPPVMAGTYYVYAVDGAGNRTKDGMKVVVDRIDLTAPSITNAAQDASAQGAELVFTVDAADAQSGLNQVFWSKQSSGATTGTALVKKTGNTYTSAGTGIGAPGTYYIYATDNVGNRNYEGVPVILGDTAPPEVSNTVATPEGWATGKYVSATVTDLLSGISTVYASLQPTGAMSGFPMKLTDTPNVYQTYITLPGDTYYVYAVDTAGNRTPSGVKIEVTQVDTTAPSITNAEQDAAKSTYGAAVFHATVTDTESGVKEVYWSTSPSLEETGTETGTTMTHVGGGVYEATGITDSGSYYIYAVDNVGNRTSDGTWVKVEVQEYPSPDIFNAQQEPAGWAREKLIRADVVDTVSGIASVFYSTQAIGAENGTPMLSSGIENEYVSEMFATPGTYYVYAENTEGHRNKLGVEVTVDKIDLTAPVISGAAAKPDGWATAKHVEAAVSDGAGSGVMTVFFSASPEASAPAGDAYVMAKDDAVGVYKSGDIDVEGTYYVIAEDMLGNRSVSGVVEMSQIDTEGPEIWNYRQSRSPLITAVAQISDGGSGLARAFISKNRDATEPAEAKYTLTAKEAGKTEFETGAGIDVTAEGEYYFVIAYDNAGNRSVSDEFIVTDEWGTGQPTIISEALPEGWAREKTVRVTAMADMSVDAANNIVSVHLNTNPNITDPNGAGSIRLIKGADGYWTSPTMTSNGNYTVIAIDSKGTIGYGDVGVIKIDRDAPFFGTPAQNEEGVTAFKTATVDVMDGETGSGVSRAFISENPNATEAAGDEYNMTRAYGTETWTTGAVRKEGTYVAIAYDQVGNRAVSASFQITDIDPYPPEIKVPPMLKTGSAANTMVLYTDVTDVGSGVSRAFISTNWMAETPVVDRDAGLYAYEMTRDADTDRWQTGDIIESDFVSYYIIAYDVAGNRTVTDAAYEVKTIDDQPPDILSAVQRPDGPAVFKGITAEVTDNMSGVKRVWYSDRFINSTFIAENEMTLNSATGKYETQLVNEGAGNGHEVFAENGTWYVYAEDNNGNVTARGTRVDISDITKGSVVISSVTKNRDEGWTNRDVLVTAMIEGPIDVAIELAYFAEDKNAASGTEMAVGVDSMTAEFVVSKATYTLTETQDKTYYVNAIGTHGTGDKIPAVERIPFRVQIDKEPPVLSNIAQEAVGAVTGDYAKARRISATITDTGGSGMNTAFISTDNAARLNADGTLPEGAILMTKQLLTDTYTSADVTRTGDFYIIAYDAAGNRTVSPSAIRLEKIDTGAPTIGSFTHTPETSASKWGTGADYTLKVTGLVDDNSVAELWLGTENSIAKAAKVDVYTAGAATCDIPVNPPDGQVTYYLWAKDGAGNVSDAASTTIYKDTLGPTAIVKEGKNAWQTFLSVITFGLYYKEDTVFNIDTFDTQPDDVNAVSGLKNTKYYIRTVDASAGAVEETYDEFIAASASWVWTDYTALTDIRLAAEPNVRRVVYARTEDNAGNVTYTNSEGMVFDNTAPSFSDAKQSADGWAVEKTISATVTDATAGVARVFWSEDQNAETGSDEYAAAAGSEPLSYAYAPATVFADSLGAAGKDVYIIAYDAAGNRGVQTVHIDKIDKEKPVIGGLTHDPLTSTSSLGTASQYTLKATGVTDDVEATEIWYGTQNDVAAAKKYDGYTAGAAAADITVTPEKMTTYYVWAKDAAGNVSDAARTTIYLAHAPFEDETDPMYWMGQKTGGDSNRAMVWFGNYAQSALGSKSPVLWRALASNGAATPFPGQVTLLTEYMQNTVEETGSQFWLNSAGTQSNNLRAWMNGQNGMIAGKAPGSSAYGQTYYSDASENGRYLNYYDSTFNDAEKSLIAASILPGETGTGGVTGAGAADKIFALSNGEASNTAFFAGNTDRKAMWTPVTDNVAESVSGQNVYNGIDRWYLRTPSTTESKSYYVLQGEIRPNITTRDMWLQARPALNLDPEEVMFVAAAADGGTAATGAALAAAGGTAPSSYSLTPDVGGATFRVFERNGVNTELTVNSLSQDGNSFKVTYSGASAGANNHMGVMLVDQSTQKKYIGRVANIADASDEVSFNLPDSAEKSIYRLFIWNEYEDGDTKYAYPRYTKENIDTEPPVVGGLTHTPATAEGSYSNAAGYTLAVTGLTDNVRVDEIWYGTQNDIAKAQKYAGYTPGSAAVDIAVTPAEGITTYYIWAKDTGNISEPKSVTVYKDTLKPTTGIPAVDGEWNTSENVAITVGDVKDDTSATTDVSGVAKVLIDTKTIATADQTTAKAMTLTDGTATITLPQADGTTTYYVRALDGAGNFSDEKTLSVQQDTTPPEIKLVMSTTAVQPVFGGGDALVLAGGAVNETYVKYRFTGFTEPDAITYDMVFSDNAGIVTTWAELSDDGSGIITEGVPKFGIYFSDTPLTKDELAALPDSDWKQSVWGDGRGMMDSPLSGENEQKEGRFIIYARAQDKAGNWGYASTQGYLVDRSNPTVSDVKYEKENLTADGWSSSIKVSAKIDDVARYTTGAAQSGVDEDAIYASNALMGDGTTPFSVYGFPQKEADGRWSMTFDFWPDPDMSAVAFVPWDLSSNPVLGFDKVDPDKRAPGLPNYYYGSPINNQPWNKTFVLFDELTKIDAVAPDVGDVAIEPAASSWSPSKSVSATITDTSAWIHGGAPKQDAKGRWYTDPDFTDPYYDHGEGGSGLKEAFLSTNKNANAADAGSIPVTLKDGKYSADIAKNGTYYLISTDNVGNRTEKLAGTVDTIDFTAPVIGSVTHEPLTTTDSFSSSAAYTVKLTGIADAEPGDGEAKSGVAEIWYGTENDVTKAQKAAYTADAAAVDIAVTPEEGGTTYYVWAKDRAGNVSTTGSTTIYKDTQGPRWVVESPQPLFWRNDETYTVTSPKAVDYEPGLYHPPLVSGIEKILIDTVPITSADQATAREMTLSTSGDLRGSIEVIPEKDGRIVYYMRAVDHAGNIGDSTSITLLVDRTAPTGTIKEGMNAWQSFLNAITFGLYYKDKTTFTIESADPLPDGVAENSGVLKMQYYIRDFTGAGTGVNETPDEFLEASKDWVWQDYGALSSVELTIEPNVKRVVYAKITDIAGNVTYVSSQGMIFDSTKPTVGTAEGVTVDPLWVNAAHTGTVTVTAAQIEDVLSNNVESGVAHAYLMKNNTGTASDDIAYELTKSGTNYTANVPQPAVTTQYFLRAVDHAGNWNDADKSLPVAVQIDKTAPAYANAKQNTEDWAASKTLSATVTDSDSADGSIISSGIARIFWSDDENATSGNDEYTATGDAPLKAYDYQGTTPIAEEIGTDGKDFYIISYDVAGNRSVQTVTVGKIDRSAPQVQAPAYDKAVDKVTVQAADALSGLGSMAQSGPFAAESGVYCTTDPAALPERITETAALDGAVKLTEREAEPGTFDVSGLAEGYYYIFAMDATGNVSAKQEMMSDNTPPVIDNVSFTSLGSGKWRISFTALDTGVGMEDAEVKWSADKTSFPNTAVKDTAVDNGYYFEVTADVNNVPHYVQATDKNGNAAMREVYDEKNVINVSVPMKLMFASFPNVLGADFTAPVYTVTNNSNIVKTKLSVSGFEAMPGNGFTLVAPGTPLKADTLTLYMQGMGNEEATAFGAMGRFNLMPGADFGEAKPMGKLAVKPSAGDDPASRGMFTYAGDVFPYNPANVPTLRGEFTTTLKFENVRFE